MNAFPLHNLRHARLWARWFYGPIALATLATLSSLSNRAAIAQSTELCPTPALERIATHTVATGDTLDTIAAQYNLLPISLLAMNSALQAGTLPAGMTLKVPPFNGAEVQVSAGQTWQDVAQIYRARADVLFEVNGCPDRIPSRIFVPGVSWLLDTQPATATTTETADNDPLSTYPLSENGSIIANYGWQTEATTEELRFSSGVTISTPLSAAVVAAGSGTVAYVGEEGPLGMLIVVNHAQGLQTRYANVTAPTIRSGDQVTAGQRLATPTPQTDETAILYFEVRTNSALGWVARDPGDYIPELAIR